jgi:choline dehydrogenase-like flavoprotein
MKIADAVVIGAGAGGGVVAKELAVNGLHVVLLERGRFYHANDCRKDDLHNQRTSILGNNTGPDDDGNPRVAVDLEGKSHVVVPSQGAYSNNAACVGGGTATYGAMAWRFMPQDFRMKSIYGCPDGSTLEDWPISYDDLESHYEKAESEIGVSGDDSGNPFKGAEAKTAAHAATGADPRASHSGSGSAAARAAPFSHPYSAQHGPVQRTAAMHAVPLVRRLFVRGECQVRHAEYRDPDGARQRQLRATNRGDGEGNPVGRSRPRHWRRLL